MAFWRSDDRAKKKARRAASADNFRYLREIALLNERAELNAGRRAQSEGKRIGLRSVGGLQNTIGGAAALDALAADFEVLPPRAQRARKVAFAVKPVVTPLTAPQQALVTIAQSGALNGVFGLRLGGMF